MAKVSKLTEVKVHDDRATQALYQALRGRARGRTELVKVTAADAVAMTGMPSDQAEPALKQLVAQYRSHLAVTEAGDLVYEFEPSLKRRDKVSLGEWVRRAGEQLWRGFQVFFKVWIAVTLVAYVVAFVAMMLALIFARQGNDRDDRRGGGFGFPWLWYWLLPDLAPTQVDRYGRQLRRKPPSKRFYHSVFDFVFGPTLPPLDPRETEKAIVAYLRDHGGRITASEVVALRGLSLADAEQELTRLMAEFNGEVEVSDDGTLIYVFQDLLVSAEAAGAGWQYDFDTPEIHRRLTGNTTGANLAVGGFAGFNLLGALTIGPTFLERFALAGDATANFFVSWFPLAFSSIFFAVPGVRWLKARGARRRLERQSIRRALMREIWTSLDGLDPKLLCETVAIRTATLPAKVQKELDQVMVELDGDIDNDADGKVLYRFKRLSEERIAVERARLVSPAQPQLGNIVFSSEET